MTELGSNEDIGVRQLHPEFAAELSGIDITQHVTTAVRGRVEAAMAKYAVVVIRGQVHASDQDHVRFSRAFGPLELPPNLGILNSSRPMRVAAEVYDVSNLDDHGEMDRPDSLRRRFAKGNEEFHTDSSFNDLPTKWSLLRSVEVPDEGGNTEFVDTRTAYDQLPDDLKKRIANLEVQHSLSRSRAKGGMNEASSFDQAFPPVVHPLVRESASGRKALYIGSHASWIVGQTEQQSRDLLDMLVAHATQPQHIYSHQWQTGDLVIWDNRCTMHRVTTFNYLSDRRDLRRTTINEFGTERSGSKLR
jgi:alpha-ketoglutarate-dependent 2,4-dichlorophenoxyacetate dioxygenase